MRSTNNLLLMNSILASLLILLIQGRGETVSFVPMGLDELSQKADIIVHGEIIHVKSEWTKDNSSIRTIVFVSVQEQWKGKPTSSLSFIQPGGSIGEISEEVPGLPTFQSSDKVILFLKEIPGNGMTLFGGEQGRFLLTTDLAGNRVVEDSEGQFIPLKEFACRVKSLLGEKEC